MTTHGPWRIDVQDVFAAINSLCAGEPDMMAEVHLDFGTDEAEARDGMRKLYNGLIATAVGSSCPLASVFTLGMLVQREMTEQREFARQMVEAVGGSKTSGTAGK